MKISLFSIVLLLVAVMTRSAQSAELRLRQQCTPQSALVKLGDVAEIFSVDAGQADSLKKIELFPAPISDQPRMLRVGELQDLLAARGVNLTEHRFSGFAQVQIVADKKRNDQPLNEQVVKRAQRRLQEAIQKYLQEKSSNAQQRTLQFDLASAQQRTVANTSSAITVRGGNSPWNDVQKLTISVETAEGQASFPLEVRVSTPSAVVAAVHAMPRGAVIHASDLTLVNGDPRDDGDNGAFHSLEEVVGKQTTKAIAEGKVFTPDAVQSPLMVRRGDVVTVYARTAGIRIHTTARAKDDGALGDLVAVESMTDRKQYTVRISGPRETEVFAQAASAQ